MTEDTDRIRRTEQARCWFSRQHFSDRTAGIKETCQRFNDYDMERISKGELQDEIDYLKARAIREGRANE
jgi:hypothetical protein